MLRCHAVGHGYAFVEIAGFDQRAARRQRSLNCLCTGSLDEITMTVPTPDGIRSPLVLAAAHIAGVDRAYAVGGAQAIAALAYGTATIARVDKIVGPGGSFVAAAKRLVFGVVGIDVIAGPSEVFVVGDGSAPADWVALDLFSQAEHDASAQAILISPDAGYLDGVFEAMSRLLAERTR